MMFSNFVVTTRVVLFLSNGVSAFRCRISRRVLSSEVHAGEKAEIDVIDNLRRNAADKSFFNKLIERDILEKSVDLKKKACALKSECSILRTDRGDVKILEFSKDLHTGGIAPNALFVRSFYDKLLAAVRSYRKVILLGNPGIGKSTFQYYYLWRILNAHEHDQLLSTDSWGKEQPPKVVVRQIGDSEVEVYDTETGQKMRAKGEDVFEVLTAFDSPDNLYLFEPGETFMEPKISLSYIPTIATVSPDIRRYKEFSKNGGIKLYMPAYEEEELLGICEYLQSREDANTIYTLDEVKKRYHQFGGMIRQVFPADEGVAQEYEEAQLKAIEDFSINRNIFNFVSLNTGDISSYVMQYEVDQEHPKLPFRYARLNFVGEDVLMKLRQLEKLKSIESMVLTLQNDDVVKQRFYNCELIMEDLFVAYVTTADGIGWERRLARSTGATELKRTTETAAVAVAEEKDSLQSEGWETYALLLTGVNRQNPPTFEEMKQNVLYYPRKDTFPAVECFFKDENNCLVAFQITRQRSPAKVMPISALEKFFDAIKFDARGIAEDEEQKLMKLFLVPHRSQAETARIKFTAPPLASTSTVPVPKYYNVLKVHDEYARR